MERPRRRDSCEYSNKRLPTIGLPGTGSRVRRQAVGRTEPRDAAPSAWERKIPRELVVHGIGFAQHAVERVMSPFHPTVHEERGT